MTFARNASQGLLYVAIVLGTMGAFLLSPPVEDKRAQELCVEQRMLSNGLGYLFNCDSYEFVRLANDPNGIFVDPGKMWQSRPAYIWLGAVAAVPFRILNHVIERVATSRLVGKDWYRSPINPYHAGYVLFNLGVLVAAGAVTVRILGNHPFRVEVLLILTVLMVNGITKGFFWTPHLQILNVFIPVFAVAVSARIQSLPSIRQAVYLGFVALLSGLASLTYGAFVLVPLAAIVATFWSEERQAVVTHIRRVVTALLLFVIPLLAWRLVVAAETGDFYMHEIVAYRQFVWMLDAASMGGREIADALQMNLSRFARTLPTALTFPVASLLLVKGAARWMGSPPFSRDERVLQRAVMAFYVPAMPFFALMGYYAPRLTWQLVPPLLIMLAIDLGRLLASAGAERKKVASRSLVVVSAAYVVFIVISDQTAYLDSVR
jgi:4-amino-4-deoxy-L-arabinose transferase-like glycosyltransferase